MIFVLFVFAFSNGHSATDIPFVDTGVEIEDCAASSSTTSVAVSSQLQCVTTATPKIELSATKSDVKIHAVIFAAKSDVGKTSVCKIKDLSKYEIEVKDIAKVKTIVYSVKTDVKALLFGTTTSECYQNLEVKTQELDPGYLRVTSIKCFPKEQVSEYHTSKSSANPKEFLEDDGKVCFLAPMLKKDINLKVKTEKKLFSLTVSATPKQECPKCPATETNSTKSTNTTSDSSTHAASTSTTIIVVVVVVIVIVLLGGVGFFMMKK